MVTRATNRESHATAMRPGFFVKLACMAVVNALGVYIMFAAWSADSWWVLVGMAVILVVIDYVYFSKRMIAAKYLMPGLIFLMIFQVFVVLYTGYVAFTNYGDGHNSSKEDAIAANLMQNQQRVDGSPALPLSVVRTSLGKLGFAVVDNGRVKVGTADQPLTEVPNAQLKGTKVVEVPGYTVLGVNDILSKQQEVVSLRVPVSDDVNKGSVATQNGTTGYIYTSKLTYDEAADTMTNTETGVVYKPNDHGTFVAADGSSLPVGWRVFVGTENFTKAFSNGDYAGPFLKVLIWNIAFAFLSVVTTFFLGLFLAIVMNSARLKGQKVYRTLMLLPYAFPSFLTALLFAGMLNRDFGFLNQVLLGGSSMEWLTNPWLAKLSILMVNLWMGFPYMFLVCTGALQSIPSDIYEAARIDGASAWAQFRKLTLPLLMVSVAPLLISSFAFNFNNFTLIFMLTGGGPRFTDTSAPIGATDLLITMVYSVSGLDGTAAKDYGLASALSIVIFLIVATVSAVTFRQTQRLEELNS